MHDVDKEARTEANKPPEPLKALREPTRRKKPQGPQKA